MNKIWIKVTFLLNICFEEGEKKRRNLKKGNLMKTGIKDELQLDIDIPPKVTFFIILWSLS